MKIIISFVQVYIYHIYFVSDKPCEVTDITGVTTVDKNSVTITFSANDSTIEFQCKLDNRELSLCKFAKYLASYT